MTVASGTPIVGTKTKKNAVVEEAYIKPPPTPNAGKKPQEKGDTRQKTICFQKARGVAKAHNHPGGRKKIKLRPTGDYTGRSKKGAPLKRKKQKRDAGGERRAGGSSSSQPARVVAGGSEGCPLTHDQMEKKGGRFHWGRQEEVALTNFHAGERRKNEYGKIDLL